MKLEKVGDEKQRFGNLWIVAKAGKLVEEVSAAPSMSVELIANPKDIEKLIVFAARSTYKGHKDQSYDKMPETRVKKMLEIFLSSGHGSVIEHGMFTFDIRNISRALTHQLVRHRMGSYTQESQHYIDYGKIMFVMPDKLTEEQKHIFRESCVRAFRTYRKFINAGYPSHEARGILPNAVASRIVASFNARSLYNFFGLRCCHRNTWEIKELAWRMLVICKAAAPTLFKFAGPRCQQLGFCPEGNLCCGIYSRMPKKGFGEMFEVK